MKTKLLLLSALASLPALRAAPLTETTAVHTKPDASSSAVSFLKAGTEPVAAPDATAPAGWMAIELPGPFEGYVQNKDLTKSLDLKPGTPIYLEPKTGAAVLTVAEATEKTTITGLLGKWTQIRLEKKLVGYVRVGSASSATVPVAATTTSAPATSASGTAAVTGSAPVSSGESALPRQFAGKLVSTRRPLAPRRPHDWALNDSAGKRFAYLDVSKLLLTEQIETFADRDVVVFGTATAVPGGKDIVIQVETLQLK